MKHASPLYLHTYMCVCVCVCLPHNCAIPSNAIRYLDRTKLVVECIYIVRRLIHIPNLAQIIWCEKSLFCASLAKVGRCIIWILSGQLISIIICFGKLGQLWVTLQRYVSADRIAPLCTWHSQMTFAKTCPWKDHCRWMHLQTEQRKVMIGYRYRFAIVDIYW